MIVLNPKQIGARLRAARKDRQISANALDRAIGASTAWVSRIEGGKRGAPDPALLLGAARALGVPLEWLLTGEDSRATLDRRQFSSVHKSMGLFEKILRDETDLVLVTRIQQALELIRFPDGYTPSEDAAREIVEQLARAIRSCESVARLDAQRRPSISPRAASVEAPNTSYSGMPTFPPATSVTISEAPPHTQQRKVHRGGRSRARKLDQS